MAPIFFLGSHVRWNLTTPPSKISTFQAQSVILNQKVLRRARHIIHAPLDDAFDQLCVLPDTGDGGVTYRRLFDALYEYYHQEARLKGIDGHVTFGGIMVIGSRLVVNLV
jgi:hypothetical protein